MHYHGAGCSAGYCRQQDTFTVGVRPSGYHSMSGGRYLVSGVGTTLKCAGSKQNSTSSKACVKGELF